jgi:hypothetical protein
MTSWITKLEQEASNQKDHIRILQSEFDSKQWPWYLFSRGSPVTDESTMLGDIDFSRKSGRESKILEMFYQGNDLVTISSPRRSRTRGDIPMPTKVICGY